MMTAKPYVEFVTVEELLFGEQTRNVSNTYLDWRMRIANASREPEDHLGLELSFVAFLLQTIHEGDPATVSLKGISASEELRAFLENHLMAWAGDCLAKAATEAATPFTGKSLLFVGY